MARRAPRPPTRLLDPEARGTVAVAASRNETLAALETACSMELAGPADRHATVARALNAMLRSFDAQLAAQTIAFPLAVWTQGIWTMIEDPRDSLPGDAGALERLAEMARSQVVGRIARSRDGCYGFAYYDEGRCRRLFLKVADAVIEDEGRLDEEEPPIRVDPRACIDAAWRRLIPETEPTDIEVRLYRPTGVVP